MLIINTVFVCQNKVISRYSFGIEYILNAGTTNVQINRKLPNKRPYEHTTTQTYKYADLKFNPLFRLYSIWNWHVNAPRIDWTLSFCHNKQYNANAVKSLCSHMEPLCEWTTWTHNIWMRVECVSFTFISKIFKNHYYFHQFS